MLPIILMPLLNIFLFYFEKTFYVWDMYSIWQYFDDKSRHKIAKVGNTAYFLVQSHCYVIEEIKNVWNASK